MDVIKELGLEIRCVLLPCGAEDVVTVEDLRAAIEKLPMVYGSPDAPSDQLAWSVTLLDCDTHKARLIGIEKLVKEPVRVERRFNTGGIEAVIIPDEIKGKTFKVVFEEVIE